MVFRTATPTVDRHRSLRWRLASLLAVAAVVAGGCKVIGGGTAVSDTLPATTTTHAPRPTTTTSTTTTSTTTTSTTTTTEAPPDTTQAPQPRRTTPRGRDGTITPAEAPAGSGDAAAPEPPPTAPDGWRLIFADEFAGGSLDSSKWSVCSDCDNGHGSRMDDERNRASQAWVEDGKLWIRAEKAPDGWTSSPWVWTFGKFTFKHGKVEIRAKMPKGTGVWPALWMLPQQSKWPPEIDIYESIDNENRYYVNYHHGSERNPRQFHADGPHPVAADTTQWHTYGVEWYPGELRFFLDGVEVARAHNGVADLDGAAPMYLILNVAVGGDWPSEPDHSTPTRADMQVDWVRVYQR